MKKLYKKITNWEAWPFALLYAPISIFWIGYIIKSRAVWFFTPSNPKITFGGLEGEPKKEMYDLLPKELYPATFNVLPDDAIETIYQRLQTHGIRYPFIVKPEVGWQGVLMRKIDNAEALATYHAAMPWEYIVQQMVNYPMEVSVFYIRHPKDTKGIVTGFLHKIPMHIVGNGKDTVEDLLLQHPKSAKRLEELLLSHKHNLNKVLANGEKYMLSYAGNHNRGAQFVDLKDHIDEKLVSHFDKISNSIDDFFYGRYDIMCESIQDLKEGKNFSILEYNGCGAEPNHFYDTGYTLLGAYKEILKHWKALYEISKYNHRVRGIKPWTYNRGRNFIKYSQHLMKEMQALDKTINI